VLPPRCLRLELLFLADLVDRDFLATDLFDTDLFLIDLDERFAIDTVCIYITPT